VANTTDANSRQDYRKRRTADLQKEITRIIDAMSIKWENVAMTTIAVAVMNAVPPPADWVATSKVALTTIGTLLWQGWKKRKSELQKPMAYAAIMKRSHIYNQ
jgi:hypothetical protein